MLIDLQRKYVSKKYNRYDVVVITLIALLAFGTIGGALQVIRIVSLLLFPFNCLFLLQKHYVNHCAFIAFSAIWLVYGALALSWCPDVENAKIDMLYLFIHLNLVYSFLHYGKLAKNVMRSLSVGWCLFAAFTLPIALYELITNQHLYTNSIQTEMLDKGIAINGILNKPYSATTFNNYNEYVTAISFSLPYIVLCFFYLQESKMSNLFVVCISLVVIGLIYKCFAWKSNMSVCMFWIFVL